MFQTRKFTAKRHRKTDLLTSSLQSHTTMLRYFTTTFRSLLQRQCPLSKITRIQQYRRSTVETRSSCRRKRAWAIQEYFVLPLMEIPPTTRNAREW